ncbi:hypothetical protein [Rosistilla oblonga]|uniref:hypothetical protein n=1 Tax=Rosistilla oblonga TaxID=2527990 RepID=UPI003A968F27
MANGNQRGNQQNRTPSKPVDKPVEVKADNPKLPELKECVATLQSVEVDPIRDLAVIIFQNNCPIKSQFKPTKYAKDAIKAAQTFFEVYEAFKAGESDKPEPIERAPAKPKVETPVEPSVVAKENVVKMTPIAKTEMPESLKQILLNNEINTMGEAMVFHESRGLQTLSDITDIEVEQFEGALRIEQARAEANV